MAEQLNIHPDAATSLAKWHVMISKADMSGLRSIVHPEAIFRSPVAFNPYKSADALILAIETVNTVFSNFAYHRETTSADGLTVVLEFSANVGDKGVKGVDLIRFDATGKIVDFEVIIRPLSGLQALAEEMGKRLSGQLPAYKMKA